MNNITYCGNFIVKSENEIVINKLVTAANLLNKKDNDLISYIQKEEEIIYVEIEDKGMYEMDFHTFLFFHDFEKYWLFFGNMNKVNINFILEDLTGRESYLEFENIQEQNKGLFASEFMTYLNNNIPKIESEKLNKSIKNLLLSFWIKNVLEKSSVNIEIPIEYQKKFLSSLSDERIFQYNWRGFKKIFKAIHIEIKKDFFSNKSILEFFSPMIKHAYTYEFKEGILTYKNTKLIKVMRNDFEKFFISNQTIFKNISLIEQKSLFKIFIHHSRKEMFDYMFYQYDEIRKENYSTEEFIDLLNKVKKGNLDVDLEKHFLFKKLNHTLEPKLKEKRIKI